MSFKKYLYAQKQSETHLTVSLLQLRLKLKNYFNNIWGDLED